MYFHHSTPCLVFLENSETHIGTIPQVSQWTHAEQVSHFISFSITGGVAVGCALAGEPRKAGSDVRFGCSITVRWSRGAKAAHQMKHYNDFSNATTAPRKQRKKIRQLVLCFFPFPLRKSDARVKGVIGSEGQV